MYCTKMVRRVLVICQRKRGLDKLTGKDVSITIVPVIENIIHSVLGDDLVLDFLTCCDKDHDQNQSQDQDYQINIDKNPETTLFIEQHKHTYSLILLHTCPFRFLGQYFFDCMYQLLDTHGCLMMTMRSSLIPQFIPIEIMPPIDIDMTKFIRFPYGFRDENSKQANTYIYYRLR